MTTVAVHQPNFVPYLGFFRKMARCDVFILYDTAQYSKDGFHNRNRIKTPRGPAWITVPVNSPHLRPIKAVKIDNSSDWGTTIWRTLQANYARAAHFHTYASELGPIFTRESWEALADLNLRLITAVRRALGLDVNLVRASELRAPSSEDASERLVQLVHEVGGSRYLSGPGGQQYLNPAKFRDIALDFLRPVSLSYPQLWGSFLPDLSVLDVLFNCGPSVSKDLLWSEAPHRVDGA